MFKITSREIKTITPALAKQLLTHNDYVSQRNVRPAHIRRLAEAITSGSFHTGNIALAENGDGKQRLVNGQHQLYAVVESGKPIQVVLETAKCKTPADMAMLYAQYDVNATRSIRDIVKAESNTLGVDWFHRTAPLLASALSHMSGVKGESKHDKAKRIRDYIKEGNFVDQFITSDTKHLWRFPVVVAMMHTYWKDKDDAQRFWDAVATGEMLTKKDPRLTLRTYLLSNAPERRELYARCIIAWNAFRRGKTTSLKYHPNKNIPAAV